MTLKFVFEVTTEEQENNIRLTVSYGTIGNVVQKTVKDVEDGDGYEKLLDELCQDCIDNMRLTVKERNEAQHNLKIFKEYLSLKKQDRTSLLNNEVEQLIVEDQKENDIKQIDEQY